MVASGDHDAVNAVDASWPWPSRATPSQPPASEASEGDAATLPLPPSVSAADHWPLQVAANALAGPPPKSAIVAAHAPASFPASEPASVEAASFAASIAT